MKSSSTRTSSAAGSSDTTAIRLVQSNSEPETSAKYADVKQRLMGIRDGVSYDALMAHGGIGIDIIAIKKFVGHGNFERVADKRLDIGKTWRTQLMKLGKNLDDVKSAIAWAQASEQLKRSELSVAGALSLLKEWQQRDQPKSNEKSASSTVPHMEMSWADVVGAVDSAKDQLKGADYGVDQSAALLRTWEAGSEKTGSPAEPAKKRSYSQKEKNAALVLMFNLALLAFKRLAVLESELERERTKGAPTAPAPFVQDAIFIADTTPEALINNDSGGAPPC